MQGIDDDPIESVDSDSAAETVKSEGVVEGLEAVMDSVAVMEGLETEMGGLEVTAAYDEFLKSIVTIEEAVEAHLTVCHGWMMSLQNSKWTQQLLADLET